MAHILHGKKRSAEGEPEGDRPLAKKLGRLHLNSTELDGIERRNELSTPQQNPPDLFDPMLLDDTKDTIFVHDIDRELSEHDTQEGAITLLPGAFTSIPKSIITNAKPQRNELVLYREPTSLTIPVEEDKVRRAIAETRARIRARHAGTSSSSNTGNSSLDHERDKCRSDDAMDIDVAL